MLCVTDKKLLDKTGGIVQGMSGSPIIQNGKLTLHYDSYTKTYERKADWIFASTYNENNTLTDTIKGKADEIDGGSQLTVRESDFLNNGDRQTREVVDFVPQAIELSSKNRNQ